MIYSPYRSFSAKLPTKAADIELSNFTLAKVFVHSAAVPCLLHLLQHFTNDKEHACATITVTIAGEVLEIPPMGALVAIRDVPALFWILPPCLMKFNSWKPLGNPPRVKPN